MRSGITVHDFNPKTLQLMELAGLACAQTLATVYKNDKYPRVLVCCGPGNQGTPLQSISLYSDQLEIIQAETAW